MARTGDSFVRHVLVPAVVVAAVLVVCQIGGSWNPAFAQTTSGPRTQTRAEADRYVDRVIDGQKVSCMYGNVFIDRDTLSVRADTAFYSRNLL